jgi:hypothetical protein
MKRKEIRGKKREARGMGMVTIFSEEGEHVQLSGSKEN